MEFLLSEKNDITCGKYSVAGRTFYWQQMAVLERKISQAQKFRFLRLMLAYIEPLGHVLARGGTRHAPRNDLLVSMIYLTDRIGGEKFVSVF